MKRSAHGFTLVEMLMVIVIMGVLVTILMPRISRWSTQYTVDSARQEVAAYLAQARAAAIQNGRNTWFVRSGNTIGVSIDTGSANGKFARTVDLYADHGVAVSMPADPDSIRFDPRGIAVGVGGKLAIVVSKMSVRDSVCIIGLGKISTKDCAL